MRAPILLSLHLADRDDPDGAMAIAGDPGTIAGRVQRLPGAPV